MTDRLFKLGSFEEELMNGMKDQLALTKDHNKVAYASQAIDHLNSAAALFDKVGKYKEAEILTNLIEKFAEGADIEKLIEESLPKKSLFDEMIEEEINRQEVEDIINKKNKHRFDPSEPLMVEELVGKASKKKL